MISPAKTICFLEQLHSDNAGHVTALFMQQLANMTMEGSRERRYFSAVAGDRTQQGELFGYANLFQMRRPGSNLALDILKVDTAYLNS